MPHDVIMPALGMAQDTGLLVAWRKAPGDAVAKGEPLFEVETDKATMEVEAGADGFLSSVMAADGTDVPVGQVIARIVETAAEVETGRAAVVPKSPRGGAAAIAANTADAAQIPLTPSLSPEGRGGAAAKAAPVAQAVEPGRILASPKARRMAAEAGLDLSRLARAGHAQPYHVADLDRLRGLASVTRSTMAARAEGTALRTLLAKANESARVFAAFAKGAWRHVTGGDLTVTLLRPDGSLTDEGGTLMLADLTGTRLTAYAPPEGLVLAVAPDPAGVTLTLTFDEAALPFATACKWLNELAARLEDPVRQLI